MRLNTQTKPAKFTHEGAPAKHIDPEAQLRRLVMASLLWERQFYVDGRSAADQMAEAARAVPADTLASVAVEARERQHLRHTPLFLTSVLAATNSGNAKVKHTIEAVVQRADELAEFLAIYCDVTGQSPKDMHKLPGQVKKGLALAFGKFDAYQLAKYDRKNAITLLDVARLVHPKHTDAIGALVKGELTPPDTWEVALSGGADKAEAFTRLLNEGKLGYLALLRNLRNMEQAGVDRGLVKAAIRARKGAGRVLPFRYVAAAVHAPWAADALNDALLASLGDSEPFDGETVILLDHSGSMDSPLSARSEMMRYHAAGALAAVWPGDKRVFSFATGGFYGNPQNETVEIAPIGGLPMVDAYINCQRWGGTYLGDAIRQVEARVPKMRRFVVVTDEQSHDRVGDPACRSAYMINVGAYQNGVGYGAWTHIDGWSENVLRFIREREVVTD